jgi:hypothetical protein
MMKALSNINTLDLPTFLDRNRITQDDFTKSNIDWELLKTIGLEHWSLRVRSRTFFDQMK